MHFTNVHKDLLLCCWTSFLAVLKQLEQPHHSLKLISHEHSALDEDRIVSTQHQEHTNPVQNLSQINGHENTECEVVNPIDRDGRGYCPIANK